MSPDASGEAATESFLSSRARSALGWCALALLFGYAIALHQGLGSPPGGIATMWWHPSQFLLDWESVGSWVDSPGFGVVMLGLPAAVLVAAVFLGTRSSVARMLALSCLPMVALFGFYGFTSRRPWNFFHWRGSLVMVFTALSVGAAAAAPLLGASWLRRHWSLKLALYLPVVLLVMALLRNATGTDESLPFNFSPWPAVPIFGLEIGAYAIAGLLMGLALGTLGFAEWSRSRVRALVCIGIGALLPIGWLLLRFGSIPDGSAPIFSLVIAVSLGLAAITSGAARREKLLRRSLHLALGAALVILPLLSGRALATGDYTVTRFVRAQQLIDALQAHYQGRDEYPETLDQLVELGYLDAIPRPRVGFGIFYSLGWFEPIEFSYQSLGSSYVLEFEFTEWVQCAYNPPWEDDEEYEDEYEEEYAEEDGSDGAWSCPDSRPELW
jgi:hypothetical protein